MRRFLISVLAALLLALASFGSALGHVHGITPLGCMTNDAANAGANQTEDGPADSENGGPLFGQIPIGTGNASFADVPGIAGTHSVLCD
jgi:hypothetical protein